MDNGQGRLAGTPYISLNLVKWRTGQRHEIAKSHEIARIFVRVDYALANRGAVIGFGRSLATKFAKLYGWNVDVNVDAVQQRS